MAESESLLGAGEIYAHEIYQLRREFGVSEDEIKKFEEKIMRGEKGIFNFNNDKGELVQVTFYPPTETQDALFNIERKQLTLSKKGVGSEKIE